ncbi:hypothetical protein KR50_13540 [Jeotgalibacillus campisalis]|uniref:Uncharacterized protein n=1 Tax=Jeotgalibacillus campisalis TaxID=220754 RepID=A0A0C2VW04_9BACL|nr:hypothetical protein KR50_13540 [Jeotgalibacillus campisalis]
MDLNDERTFINLKKQSNKVCNDGGGVVCVGIQRNVRNFGAFAKTTIDRT